MPPEDRDRVGLRVDGQLPAAAEPSRIAGMAGVDEADDRQPRPGPLAQAPGQPPADRAGRRRSGRGPGPDGSVPGRVRSIRGDCSWVSTDPSVSGSGTFRNPGPRPARPRRTTASRPAILGGPPSGFPSSSSIGRTDALFQLFRQTGPNRGPSLDLGKVDRVNPTRRAQSRILRPARARCVTVVIVNYNSWPDVVRLVGSLAAIARGRDRALARSWSSTTPRTARSRPSCSAPRPGRPADRPARQRRVRRRRQRRLAGRPRPLAARAQSRRRRRRRTARRRSSPGSSRFEAEPATVRRESSASASATPTGRVSPRSGPSPASPGPSGSS